MAFETGVSEDSYEVVVIGGGLAGLATAASLVSSGVTSVLVLESEAIPGAHSSGRNAGLVRQAAEDPETTRLCVRGAELIRHWSGDRPKLFQQCGSLILSNDEQVPQASWDQVEHQMISEDEVRSYYPELQEWPGGIARWTATDGIVDVPRLLGELLDRLIAGGGEVAFGVEAGRIEIEGPRQFQVKIRRDRTQNRISRESVRCRNVVVANGAWAAEFSELSEMPIDLFVTNRGCLITSSGSFDPADRPWIWADQPGWYLRRLGEGWLWSACEEEMSSAADLSLSTDLESYWRAKTEPAWGTVVSGLKVSSAWVGQRTFCPDRRFLLGEDARCEGWHWAVGLGGHGVTSALAVGEQLARSVRGQKISKSWSWSEDRFVSSSRRLS